MGSRIDLPTRILWVPGGYQLGSNPGTHRGGERIEKINPPSVHVVQRVGLEERFGRGKG